MRILRPAPIEKSDTIRLVSPAGPVDEGDLEKGMPLLKAHYNIEIGSNSFARSGFFAGDDEQRGSDLVGALSEPKVKAVLATRGGWGTSRILSVIDFDKMRKNPKWIIGSSDVTALLLEAFASAKLMTIHGPMAAQLGRIPSEDVENLFALMEGMPWRCPCGLIPVIEGSARGPMIGGNLTVLAHMCGSIDSKCTTGAILFLEDTGEKPYRIDRCLVQLMRCGIIAGVVGVVLGEFTDCGAGRDGESAEEVLERFFSRMGVPVAKGFPAAHGQRNAPFVHGAFVDMRVKGSSVSIAETSR